MSEGISMKSKGPRRKSKGRTKSGRRYSTGLTKRRELPEPTAKRGSHPQYQLWSGPAGDPNSFPLTMGEAIAFGLTSVWEHHPTTHQEFEWPVPPSRQE